MSVRESSDHTTDSAASSLTTSNSTILDQLRRASARDRTQSLPVEPQVQFRGTPPMKPISEAEFPVMSRARPDDGVMDDPVSSESDDDDDDDRRAGNIHRQLSTQRTNLRYDMEGFLLKKTKKLQGLKKRWFSLHGASLFYSKAQNSAIRIKVDVKSASIVESSTKNLSNGFEIITAMERLILQAPDRNEMDRWISALKVAAIDDSTDELEHFWYFPPLSKLKYCHICGQLCSAVKRGMACEVCRLHVHTRCVTLVQSSCKWTCFADVPDAARTESGEILHQWTVGNFGSNSKCSVCHKTCGSSVRLQDLRCLWCKQTVHSVCRLALPTVCSLGRHRVSLLPPTAITRRKNGSASLSHWIVEPPSNTNPLIAFVNPKSGSNDGVKVMRMLKRILNPMQVFDLSRGGPREGLLLLRDCGSFRALGCGGDGTIGWILQEADKLGVTNLQLGVLPLGTGNDIARVLGWGPSFDDDEDALSDFIDSVEKSKVKLLDRWSIFSSSADTFSIPFLSPSGIPSHMQSAATSGSASPHASPRIERKIIADPAFTAVASTSTSAPPSPNVAAALKCKICSTELSAKSVFAKLLTLQDVKRYSDKFEQSITLYIDAIHAGGVNDRDQGNTLPISSYQLKFRMSELQEATKIFLHDVAKDTIGEAWKVRLSKIESSFVIVAEDAKKFCFCGNTSDPAQTSLLMKEISVMNNYFGIGLDAKISLDFNTMREENPAGFRSRVKNQMWYGILGSKEMLLNTCKNLHHRLRLKCDGFEIELPKLQGIVLLNISSYMGGTNFWGTKADDKFRPQCPDDGLVEVVAVKGSSQMAASKVIGITPHRLWQARYVQILISEGDPIPIQADGEAWMQPPGCITIRFKNCIQMLSRDKEFQRLLLSWKAPEAATVAHHPLAVLDKHANDLVRYLEIASERYPAISESIIPICNRLHVLQSRLFKSHLNSKQAVRPSRSKLLEYVSTLRFLLQSCRGYIDFPVVQASSPLSDDADGPTRVLLSLEDRIPLAELPSADALLLSMNMCQQELSKAESMIDQKVDVFDVAKQFPQVPPGFSRRGSDTDGTPGSSLGNSLNIRRLSIDFPTKPAEAAADADVFEESTGSKRDGGSPFSRNPQDVINWTHREICDWARSNDLNEFVDSFRRRRITGRQFLGLQEEALATYGVSPAAIAKFLSALQSLKESEQFRGGCSNV